MSSVQQPTKTFLFIILQIYKKLIMSHTIAYVYIFYELSMNLCIYYNLCIHCLLAMNLFGPDTNQDKKNSFLHKIICCNLWVSIRISSARRYSVVPIPYYCLFIQLCCSTAIPFSSFPLVKIMFFINVCNKQETTKVLIKLLIYDCC